MLERKQRKEGRKEGRKGKKKKEKKKGKHFLAEHKSNPESLTLNENVPTITLF